MYMFMWVRGTSELIPCLVVIEQNKFLCFLIECARVPCTSWIVITSNFDGKDGSRFVDTSMTSNLDLRLNILMSHVKFDFKDHFFDS